ncbi:MAG TPA: CopD family protein [Steroidobacteraceae bacterium]|nr:CopD family protein [Steroidobacteraceae bacterium]
MWDAAAVVLKTMEYAATLAASGAVLFLAVCGRLLTSAELTRLRRCMLAALVIAAATGGARIFATAGALGGDAAGMMSGPLLSMAWHGGLGLALTIRVASLGIATLAARVHHPSVAGVAAAVAAATSFVWVGHARALPAPALPTALESVHLVCAAFWIGSLAPLLMIVRGPDPARAAEAAARFSAAATLAVGVLVLAGAFLLRALLPDLASLWTSEYGRLVALKLATVALLLGLAALNKWRLTPRLRGGDAGAVRGLSASIAAEMVLAAAVLALTAAFTTISGPPDAADATRTTNTGPPESGLQSFS